MESEDDIMSDSGRRQNGNNSPRFTSFATFKPRNKVVAEELKKPPKRRPQNADQQYYNRLTQSPKMTTKTRFRWRYKNRMCVEQKTVQHIGGKQVPVARQLVYMTDSSDDNEHVPNDGERVATDEEMDRRSSVSENSEQADYPPAENRQDDIEWDYSDIKLTVGGEHFLKNGGELDGYVKVKGQILPNFEHFDDIPGPKEKNPTSQKRAQRRKRPRGTDKPTEIVTKVGYHFTGNLRRGKQGQNGGARFRENRNISSRSDSGYLDIGSGSASAQENSSQASKRDTSIDTEDDLAPAPNLPRRDRGACGFTPIGQSSSGDVFKWSSQEDSLTTSDDGQKGNSSFSKFRHSDDDLIYAQTSSAPRRDVRNDMNIITEQDFEDSLEICRDRPDPKLLKTRSKSLEQFNDSTSFYDSLEGTPRSRHNKSMEFINEHYDISCSLCKHRHSRRKCDHSKQAETISHPLGTLRRENAFIKEESSGGEQDASDSNKLDVAGALPNNENIIDLVSECTTSYNTGIRPNGYGHLQDTPKPDSSVRRSKSFDQKSLTTPVRPRHRPERARSVYEKLSKQTGERLEPAPVKSESVYRQRFLEQVARRRANSTSSSEKPSVSLFRSASFNDNLNAAELASRPKVQLYKSSSMEHVSQLDSHLSCGRRSSAAPYVERKERSERKVDKEKEERSRSRAYRDASSEHRSMRDQSTQDSASANKSMEDKSTQETSTTSKSMEDKSTQHSPNATSEDSDCIFETHCQVTLTHSLLDPKRRERDRKATKATGNEHDQCSPRDEAAKNTDGDMDVSHDSIESNNSTSASSTSTTSSYTSTSTYTSRTSTTSASIQSDAVSSPPGNGVAILDFSEMVPTVTVKTERKPIAKEGAGPAVKVDTGRRCADDRETHVDANNMENGGSNRKLTVIRRSALAPNVIVPAAKDVPSDVHDWSFDVEERAENSSSSDEGSDTPTETDDEMLRLLIPVHMFRTHFSVDKIKMSSFMELWFSQLLGMHRTILITKLIDYCHKWFMKRERHVSVFYRDNFLVVSERSDSLDQSDSPSFDLSWSPECMSTPRDLLLVEGQPHILSDVEEINDSSIERSQNVNEALAKLTQHRRARKEEQDVYSKYERTNRNRQTSGYPRVFRDLEFSSESQSSAENTSIWDSHIDSGYEIIHERKRDRSQDAIYDESSYSSDSTATFCCEDHEDHSMTFNSTVSANQTAQHSLHHHQPEHVLLHQADTIIVDGKGRGKKRYASTIVISKSENSDGTASEVSETESIASSVSSTSHRFVSAIDVPAKRNSTDPHRKMFISRPTNLRPGLEIGLHRFVCLDMPLRIYPETDSVGDTLLIEHIESDVSGSFNDSRNLFSVIQRQAQQHVNPAVENFRQTFEIRPQTYGMVLDDDDDDNDDSMDSSSSSLLSQDSAEMTDVTHDSVNDDSRCVVAPQTEKDESTMSSDLSRESVTDDQLLHQGSIQEKYRVELNMEPISFGLETEFEHMWGKPSPNNSIEEPILASVNVGSMAQIKSPTLQSFRSFENQFVDEIKDMQGHDQADMEHASSEQTLTETGVSSSDEAKLTKTRETISGSQTSVTDVWTSSSDEARQPIDTLKEGGAKMPKMMTMKKPPLPKPKHADQGDESGDFAYSVTMQFHDDGAAGPIMSYDSGLCQTPYHFDSRLMKFYQQMAAAKQQVTGSYVPVWNTGPYEEMETNFGVSASSDTCDTSTESQGLKSGSTLLELDLANCPISKVVNHILGGDQHADETFSQLKEDASLHDTGNDMEDAAVKLNHTMTELENATRVLRIMDFAGDGVDVLRLLNKKTRSKSCPHLCLDSYEEEEISNEGGKLFDCAGGTVYVCKEEMELLEKLSSDYHHYSRDAPSTHSQSQYDNQIGEIVSDELESKDVTESRLQDSHNATPEVVSDQFESSEGRESKLSTQPPDAIASANDYQTDAGTMNDASDIGGSNFVGDNQVALVLSDGESCLRQNEQSVPNDNKEQYNESISVIRLRRDSDEIRVSEMIDDGHHHATEKIGFSSDASLDFDEEKRISVNVSFEIGYKQRVPDEENLQKLIKDCKQIRDGLIQDVAKLTRDISEDIEQNVSDESLEIEWIPNSNSEDTTASLSLASGNTDQILCVNVGRRNSQRLLDILDRDLSMVKNCASNVDYIPIQEIEDRKDIENPASSTRSIIVIDENIEENPSQTWHKLKESENVAAFYERLGVNMGEYTQVVEQEMNSNVQNEVGPVPSIKRANSLPDMRPTSPDSTSSGDSEEIILLQVNSQASSNEGRLLTASLSGSQDTLSETEGGAIPYDRPGNMPETCDSSFEDDNKVNESSDLDSLSSNNVGQNYSLLSMSSLSGGMPSLQVHYLGGESKENQARDSAVASPVDSPVESFSNEKQSYSGPGDASTGAVSNMHTIQSDQRYSSSSSIDSIDAKSPKHNQNTKNDQKSDFCIELQNEPDPWKGSVSDDEHLMYVGDCMRIAFARHAGVNLADLFSDEAFDDDEWHTDSDDDVRVRRSMSAKELNGYHYQRNYYLDGNRDGEVYTSDATSQEVDEQREEEIEEYLSRPPLLIRHRHQSMPDSLSGDDSSGCPISQQPKKAKLLFIPPQGDFVVGFDGDAVTDEEGNCNTQSECTTTGRHDTTYSSINTSTSYEETEDGLIRSSAGLKLSSLSEREPEDFPVDNIMQRLDNITTIVFQDSTGSVGSRHEVDYGKFYNTSYLEKPMGVAKGPSINPSDKKPTHFHRPDNFSYTQVRKDFIKPMKKENSSMMSALGDATKVTRKRLEDFMEEPMRNREVIAMAKYPDMHKREGDEPLPIEREDWPAPAAAAAAYPEKLYKHTSPRRRSRGESDMDSTDGTLSQDVTLDDDEVEVDPRIQKDIDHLSRLESESGAAKVILEDLKKKAAEPPPLIDVISASRTPNADREPHFRTRYESHVFASPSRDLEQHARTYSVDDQVLNRKYRNALQSVGNYPEKSRVPTANGDDVDRRSYDRPISLTSRKPAMKPGYTLRQPKTAHMPATFASARANGYFSDIEQCVTRDSDFDEVAERRSTLGAKTPSVYTSQSSIEEYDPHTGLRRGGKLRGSSLSTDYSKTPYRALMAGYTKDEPPKMYMYEELKLTNVARPPGTDINCLEVHLEDSEFETIFRMSREDFYRLAEWKRNDLKKRVLLF